MTESCPLAIYQLRVVLCGVSPMIWRRLLVRSDTNLAQLHQVLQAAFGWGDYYLHEFRIHGKHLGSAAPRGAHLQLQTRTRVLNGDLEETFRQWYPRFRPQPDNKAA